MENLKADSQGNSYSFIKIMWREIVNDKLALASFGIICMILVTVFIGSALMPIEANNKVNLNNVNKPPSREFLMGTDPSGRDMIPQILNGAKNSFVIAFSVTVICGFVGVLVGLISGFYGGYVDSSIMRVLDFLSMLPRLMMIIVFVSIVPKYNTITFILMVSVLGWMSQARLIRSKTLQQSSLDYVSASKVLGTPNIVIIFREVFPNIASLVVVDLTLSLAGNMGLETGLSFLGFGLPFNTPSLGTLINYATVLENLAKRYWQWLPASLLILVMMLSINFVGQAINRASDAKQRF